MTPDTSAAKSDRNRLYADAVSQFGTALSRLVSGYEANVDLRADLLQEIHLALWMSFTNFSGHCSLGTWVYQVGHNVAINYVVKNKRIGDRLQIGLDDLEDHAEQADSTAGVDTSNSLERLRAMIQKLKMPDRQIMLLYLDDLDAAAIAQITGMSAVNVATKIHRIKQVLARNFKSRGTHHV